MARPGVGSGVPNWLFVLSVAGVFLVTGVAMFVASALVGAEGVAERTPIYWSAAAAVVVVFVGSARLMFVLLARHDRRVRAS